MRLSRLLRVGAIVAVLSVVALVISACTGPAGPTGATGPAGPAGMQGPAGPPGPISEMEPATQNLSLIMGEGKIIQELDGEEELTGEFHRWEPSTLVVNKGDKVVLTVSNPRSHAHSLGLPDFGVLTPRLEPRTGKATVDFTADKAGVFKYACATPFDESAGDCGADHTLQVGYLIVLE